MIEEFYRQESESIDWESVVMHAFRLGFEKGESVANARHEADSGRLVHCPDCVYFEPGERTCQNTRIYSVARKTQNDFCSYGERRETGD